MSTTGTNAQSLGKKHVCTSCSAKFYDFNKADAACPKCGTALPASEAPVEPAVAKARPKARGSDDEQDPELPVLGDDDEGVDALFDDDDIPAAEAGINVEFDDDDVEEEE